MQEALPSVINQKRDCPIHIKHAFDSWLLFMPRFSNFADQEEQPSKDLTVPQTHSAPGRIAHIVLELITGDPDKFMLTVDGIILRVKGAV